MLSEEELREMIANDKVVYWHRVDNNNYYCVRFDIYQFLPTGLRVKDLFGDFWLFDYKDLITEEEYKWGCEFQNIERTENLNLPNWQEINERLKNEKHIDIDFYDPKYNKHSIWLSEAQICVIDFWDDGSYGGTDDEFNKENYVKACEMAKSLFLGEKEN